jgi:hypothetical protein
MPEFGTFGAFWIWRDAGCESAMSSEATLHHALPFKLIFFVPADGWSLVAAARCRATGMTADLASTALIAVRYPEQNRHHRAGTVDCQISTMDISDDLKQGGQTAGHRELRRLPKTRFKRDSDADPVIDSR